MFCNISDAIFRIFILLIRKHKDELGPILKENLDTVIPSFPNIQPFAIQVMIKIFINNLSHSITES